MNLIPFSFFPLLIAVSSFPPKVNTLNKILSLNNYSNYQLLNLEVKDTNFGVLLWYKVNKYCILSAMSLNSYLNVIYSLTLSQTVHHAFESIFYSSLL